MNSIIFKSILAFTKSWNTGVHIEFHIQTIQSHFSNKMNLERAALNIKNNYGIIREETLACRAPSIARGSRQRWDDEVHGTCVPRRGVRRARAHRPLGQAENLGRFDFWEHRSSYGSKRGWGSY